MFELVQPRMELFEAWSEAHREWGAGAHEDGFGICVDDVVDTLDGFRAWVGRIGDDPVARWWIVEDGQVLGGIALRSHEDERVRRSGHIGYGVRPSARGRGVASWALSEVVRHAAASGIDPVLAFCRDDNPGSIATLEHCGATLEAVEQHGVLRVRRYAFHRGSAGS